MIKSRSIPVYNQEFQYHFYNLVRKGEREENKKIDMDRYNSLSLALMILAISLAFVDGAAIKLKSDRLCSQCSACDTSKCPASEAYPHMTAFDNTLIAGALQSDYVDSKDRGVYSVPNVLGGESSEHNAYFGWQSTSGSVQIEEGSYDVRDFLEEFLSMWRCVDDRYYVLASAEKNMGNLGGYDNPFVIGVDKYLEVVEVYVVTLLAKLLKDMDLAISWVEKAALPEKKRQELLRQLQSIYSDKITSLSHQNKTRTAEKEKNMHEGLPKILEAQNPSIGNNGAKEAIMNLSKQKAPCFWWFRTITLKFGNGRLVISKGSILLGCLLFLMYYTMRRKQANLKSVLKRRALSAKKAVMDLWQLAFSYQVNPLAAVQPLPLALRGSR